MGSEQQVFGIYDADSTISGEIKYFFDKLFLVNNAHYATSPTKIDFKLKTLGRTMNFA